MKTLIKNITLFSLIIASTNAFASGYKVTREKVDIITADIYQPTKKDIKATLVLFPTISGVSPLETLTAKYFADHGFLVIVPLPFATELENPNPSIEKLDADFFKPSIEALKLIEMTDKQFNLSETLPVFALGASQGGIRSVGLTSYSPRVKAAWFAVAGGDFPYIYAHSEVEAVKNFRINHEKLLGITGDPADQNYEDYLRAHLKHDPLLACATITVPIVQVMALKDNKVPTHTQEELRDACPPHKVIRINAGHVTGSISVLFMRHQIRKFFEKQI